MDSQGEFYRKLEQYKNLVLLYEDYSLQQSALKQIPLDELTNKAEISGAKSGVGTDELLIKELLKWYKFKFFSWVDRPSCETCGRVAENCGANAVPGLEIYFCSSCKVNVYFHRYNHPKKLLETRKGRCGEWANCFTFLCRALQYEARLVVEWGDHVWTEVFLPSRDQWVHCDPCENSFDSPMMYESGWGKKISYVMAFSKDEVQDVTWRYSQRYLEVLKRRTLCTESWLLKCCDFFTVELQLILSTEKKNELLLRKVRELAQFLYHPDSKTEIKESELNGRTSGSLSWRLARGECAPNVAETEITLNENEIKARKFHLKYCCASDRYVRPLDSSEIDKWDALTFVQSNVFRKVEHDWNTVYLSREKGDLDGYITWKFNFKDSGLVIESINLRLMSKIFENGSVKWMLSSGSKEINISDSSQAICTEFRGFSEFSLTAYLSGGQGPVAWQHAQLFRQSADSADYPFEVNVKFIERTV